jgi:FKBP-type peptidyl-prolyl cis-trans isomerase FkpA
MTRLDASPRARRERLLEGRKGKCDMTRKGMSAVLLGVAVLAWGCQKKDQAKVAATASPMSEDEKAVYALGASMGEQASQMLKQLKLTPAELEIFKKGVLTSLGGEKSEYTLDKYGERLRARAQANALLAASAEKEKGAVFRETAAKESGAVKTASGLVFKSLQPGKGRSPKATEVVRVNYRGTFIDGKEFDASAKHGGPVTFALNGVIPCWTEGIQRMTVGERAKLVCPSEIAYGDQPQGEIPPGSTLVFEVELLAFGPDAQKAAAPAK